MKQNVENISKPQEVGLRIFYEINDKTNLKEIKIIVYKSGNRLFFYTKSDDQNFNNRVIKEGCICCMDHMIFETGDGRLFSTLPIYITTTLDNKGTVIGISNGYWGTNWFFLPEFLNLIHGSSFRPFKIKRKVSLSNGNIKYTSYDDVEFILKHDI